MPLFYTYNRVPQGYSVAFDPLDGSSIIDTNFAVGTIFGVWPGSKLVGITGRELVAAGMAVYGPRTTMTVSGELIPSPDSASDSMDNDIPWALVKIHQTLNIPANTCFSLIILTSSLISQAPVSWELKAGAISGAMYAKKGQGWQQTRPQYIWDIIALLWVRLMG